MTERALVLIGVAQTGRLPQLQAAHQGVEAMAEWAEAQRIPADLVLECSDRDGKPVTAGGITAGVARVVEEEVSLTDPADHLRRSTWRRGPFAAGISGSVIVAHMAPTGAACARPSLVQAAPELAPDGRAPFGVRPGRRSGPYRT